MARGDEQHKNPKSDIEIAQAAAMRPIGEVAADKLDIPADAVLPYGRYKAKIPLDYIRSLRDRPTSPHLRRGEGSTERPLPSPAEAA